MKMTHTTRTKFKPPHLIGSNARDSLVNWNIEKPLYLRRMQVHSLYEVAVSMKSDSVVSKKPQQIIMTDDDMITS